MSQTLYSILKPLVFEGESGALHVNHHYGGKGIIDIREGLITNVRTNKHQGRNAVLAINCWVSIDCEFRPGANELTADTAGIDTSEVLKFLEKIDGITRKINRIIPTHQMVFAVSSSQLSNNAKLSGKDLKYALLLNGEKSVEAIIRESAEREIDVLAAVCRLVSLGVAGAKKEKEATKETVKKIAKKAPKKQTVPPAQASSSEEPPLATAIRLNFLTGLEKKLGGHFGPAAGIFIGELLEDMGVQAKTLTEQQAYDLIDQLGGHMDDGEVAQIEFWAANVLV